ncbi:MAG: N-acetylmuramoyl-L-alanine amidase, partial [Bacteroidia bacterium]|nr:N-acetylmuramoyl-L-alanine amidase [Bacteroidia bacterium]
LELNKMTIKDHLIVGRHYAIPVLIYDYNGTSIRTTIGIDDWDKAVRIKEYNDKILSKKLRRTNYMDSKILWVPFHELHCDESLPSKKVMVKAEKPEPASGNYHLEELFGKEHKMVEVKSRDLKNRVYYIVAGHGGPDPGARCTQCVSTLCEDEYAYDVSLRLARELISRGAKVHVVIQDKNDGIRDDKYLKCDTDENCMGQKIPLNQKARLRQRASSINKLYKKYKNQGIKEQLAIMIHVDSYTEQRRQDVYFFHHKTSKSSKALAESLQNTFHEKYNYYQKNRGYKGFVKPRGLYMLNFTLPTSVYVELANIRNADDQERLVKASNREALAKWLYEGMVDFQDK